MTPEDRLAAAIAAVPELHGARHAERLGGITNVNIKVESPLGAFVLRVDAPDGDILEIDRAGELANCEAASRVGVGAPVVARLPEIGVLITRFLEGHRLTPEKLRKGDRLAELAALLRRLHESCRFRGNIDMFRRQRDYQTIALARGCELPEGYGRYKRHVDRIRQAFAAHPVRPVACHNDVVAENLIDTPAGLRLIDYEYSGNNDPYSDLGDAWSESHLWLDQIEQLMGHYHGEPEPALVARARLWALVSKYGWTLWAVLRNDVSPDPDLMAWGLDLCAEASREFESDEFEHLLEDVAATSRTLSRSQRSSHAVGRSVTEAGPAQKSAPIKMSRAMARARIEPADDHRHWFRRDPDRGRRGGLPRVNAVGEGGRADARR